MATAEGCATNEIMRRPGLSKSAVWRCQERTRKMALSDEGGKVMTAEEATKGFGWRVYGLGVMALGMVCLAWGTSIRGPGLCRRCVPMLLADPSSHWIWSENAVNLALIGAAWAVADSLARPRR
jgi:hypothetical protein